MVFFRRNQEKSPIELIKEKEDLKKRISNNKENVRIILPLLNGGASFSRLDNKPNQKLKAKTASWLFGVQGLDSNPFRPNWLSVPQQANCSEGALLVYSKNGQTFHFFLNSV
jgi:hypothetical protein